MPGAIRSLKQFTLAKKLTRLAGEIFSLPTGRVLLLQIDNALVH